MSVSAVPAPFSVSPSWSWDGNDGNWSTFEISVGTPGQSFRVLPSTTGSETWVPIPQGCAGILANLADCGTLRGVNAFDGKASRGFETESSSTWDLIGIYELASEQYLWGFTDHGSYYGFDSVSVKSNPPGRKARLSRQTVAGVSTPDVWLGSLGVGSTSGHFDVENKSTPSLLTSMTDQGFNPSVSFGYTAGASYSSSKVPGSLVLGGYDQARFTPSDLIFPVSSYDNKSLTVSVESIIADNAFGGTIGLLPGGNAITTIIDSTVAQLYLPQYVCDVFAEAFGLKYDSYNELYLVNDTIHHQLLQMNPTVTFTVGSTDSDEATTNIVLPYAAFDLQAGIPFYNYSTNYFPIRVAATEDQQVLGRAFLQEAYIFVDWERHNFTLGQAIHQNSTVNIVPVLSPTLDSSRGHNSGLSTGVIAGIAVGAVAIIAIAAGLIAYYLIHSRRRRPTEQNGSQEHLSADLHDGHVKASEISSTQIYELQEGMPNKQYQRYQQYAHYKNETDSKGLMELQADTVTRELEGDTVQLDKPRRQQNKRSVYEMP